MTELTYTHYAAAADMVRQNLRHLPQVGLILGSGLGALADAIEDPDIIPTPSVPYWPPPLVEGHAGRLVCGQLEGQTVLAVQGRAHYYEGHTMQSATLPVRVMQLLGVQTMIVTNAAGGLNPDFRAGQLMLITDHINMLALVGHSPLRGPNDTRLGARFPDMSQAYDPNLLALAGRVAETAGLTVQRGVYVALGGPSFETPAEVRVLRMMGGDAVGMSTAPEVVVARHGGLRVLGISGISNVLTGAAPTLHEEVLAAGQTLVPQLVTLIRGVLRGLHSAEAT